MTGQDGKFDLQLLFQSGSTYTCLSRSALEIHKHVAATLTGKPLDFCKNNYLRVHAVSQKMKTKRDRKFGKRKTK